MATIINPNLLGSATDTAFFLLGDVRVIFRTNVDKVFRGFEANVICVNREDGDMEGCTRPEGTNMTAMNMTESSPGRRKRDLEDFVSAGLCLNAAENFFDTIEPPQY